MAKQAVENHGFDCLDLNWNFRQIRGYHLYRQQDDVHWDQHAHRMITNLILGHIADAWGVSKPKFMKPLDVDLKPRALRKHGRSHTIDSRYVDNNESNRNIDIAPRRRIVEPRDVDLNNNVDFTDDYDLSIGSKRKRVELEGIRFNDERRDQGRRRRVEIVYDRTDGAGDHLYRPPVRSMPPPNSPSLPLFSAPNTSPLQMGQPFMCGKYDYEQIPHNGHVSGFSVTHPANQILMRMPLAQQIMLPNCVPLNSTPIQFSDLYRPRFAVANQMRIGRWQNGHFF
jgi:hypothetical protein